MGDWNTLHVFNDRRFHEQVVPMLRAQRAGLEESADFTHHPGYDALVSQGQWRAFTNILPEEDHLRRFFAGRPRCCTTRAASCPSVKRTRRT